MEPKITAQTFYQYLSCPFQFWLELHGDQSRKGKNPAAREALFERGRALERRIAAEAGFEATPSAGREEEVGRETIALMKEGKRIYQGLLADNGWVGRPDFLVPKRGKSKLGNHHYTVEDVKLALELSDEHRFQLTFYALLLERIQGVRPRYAYIINGHGKRIRFEVEEFLERFDLTLGEIEKIMDGQKPAPFLSGACKESPWFSECVAEARACNDLSLVYKIWRSEYERLRKAGLRTLKDLAAADHFKLKERVPGIPAARLLRLQQQAISLVEKTHLVIEAPELPDAKVEVYFDVESDVLHTPALHYLHGLLIATRRGDKERVVYKPFLVRNPKQEGAVWKRFCAFINQLPEDAAIYHYGRYEHQVVSELAGRYGIPAETLGRFGDMIDLARVANRTVIFPTNFYSLKDLAKYLGFHWRHQEASGINSVTWYQEWRRKKSLPDGKKMLRDILEYNEDDVRATKVLKDFLATLRFRAGPEA